MWASFPFVTKFSRVVCCRDVKMRLRSGKCYTLFKTQINLRENLYNWMDNLWLKVILSNSFFCHYVFIKPSTADASKCVCKRERVTRYSKPKLLSVSFETFMFVNICYDKEAWFVDLFQNICKKHSSPNSKRLVGFFLVFV